ncbi:myelin protein zero-like protein 3 [Tiliqua scincoides]|uniref:myelin protein zero-like protein 3 n=1 Tax=Tiliqua scincoides TaxID=71010 RepID=UPI003461D811
MNRPALRFYSWAVPPLLISVWLACYAGVGNATKDNATIASNSLMMTTIHAAVLHTEALTPKSLHPFVSQTPDKEKAKEGETIVLGCQFHSSHGTSLDKLTVKWIKEDEKGQRDFMENNVTLLANYTRAVMVGNLSEGNASLTILNVTVNDHGTYFCQVILPSGEAVTGSGTKLRIRRSLGLFGIEESIGTIIGVVAAGIGGLVVLIVVLTPQLRKCLPCGKEPSRQA